MCKSFVKDSTFYGEDGRTAQHASRLPDRKPGSLRPTEQHSPYNPEATWLHGEQATGAGATTRAGDPVPNSSRTLFFSRAVSGVDADTDLVHMEVQDLGGGKPGGDAARCPQVSSSRSQGQRAHVQWLVLSSRLCTADLAVLQCGIILNVLVF